MAFSLPKVDVLEIAFILLAVTVFIYTIADLLAPIIESIYFHRSFYAEEDFWTPQNRMQIIRDALMILLSVFLLFNARHFARKLVNYGSKDELRD